MAKPEKRLVCSFGTELMAHFDGRGCDYCDRHVPGEPWQLPLVTNDWRYLDAASVKPPKRRKAA